MSDDKKKHPVAAVLRRESAMHQDECPAPMGTSSAQVGTYGPNATAPAHGVRGVMAQNRQQLVEAQISPTPSTAAKQRTQQRAAVPRRWRPCSTGVTGMPPSARSRSLAKPERVP